MAEWPEPEADPEEKRRWWSRIALAGAVGAGAILLANSGELRLPEFELPDFEMPDLAPPDLRGRESSTANPPPLSSDPMSMMLGVQSDGSPVTRPASFESCLRTIDGAAQALGPPALIEDAPERRVARFKLGDGQLTVTCADGAMTVEQGR